MENRDLELDIDTNDLVKKNFDFNIIDGNNATLQRVKIKIKNFIRDWFLDQTAGVPYYDNVLVKNPNLALVTSLFRAAIITTPGVEELDALNVSIDSANRLLSVSFRARFNVGSVEFIETQLDLT